MRAKLTISSSGYVSEVTDAGGDLDDPLSVQCIFDALRELHFKSVSSETTVVFSLFFPDDERSIWENRGEPPREGEAPSEECGALFERFRPLRKFVNRVPLVCEHDLPLIRPSRDAANVDELVAAVGAEHAAAPSLHEHEERLVQSARGLIDETKQLLAALERRDVEAYHAHGARYVIHKNELIELDFDVRTTCRGKLPPEAGTLRPTTIRYFVKRRLPRFFACLPRGTSSDFILRFEIQADGSVADVKVRRSGTERYPDEVPDPGTEPFFERLGYTRPAAPIEKDVANCMVDWFSRSQFPPPEGGPFQQRVRFSIRGKKRR